VTSPEHKPWIGGLAGAVGGIAGVFAMTALQLLFDHLHGSPPPRPVRELSQRGGRHDIARLKMRARKWRLPQKDATVRTAERLSYLLRARPIAPHQRHIAGVAVHYGFGALTGGVYGFIGERYPVIGTVSGLPFGAAVWLFAEELALPITVLSDTPDKYPLRDHLNALAAHLVFGSTTEITRRFTRELIVRAMAQRAGHDIHASEKVYMTKQKSPHAQTQQNTKPQQSDFAGDQDSSKSEDQIYARMEGAEAHNLHDVVGMAVVLGEDQGLGHLGTAVKDLCEETVAEGLDDRADLIFGDHTAVEFVRRVFEIVIQLLPAHLARELVALIHVETGVHGRSVLADQRSDAIDLKPNIHAVSDGLFAAVLHDQILIEETESLF
jgi:hypothetical protein